MCRYVELALYRPAWTPQDHARYPPRFKGAVRALLLASHRGLTSGELCACRSALTVSQSVMQLMLCGNMMRNLTIGHLI